MVADGDGVGTGVVAAQRGIWTVMEEQVRPVARIANAYVPWEQVSWILYSIFYKTQFNIFGWNSFQRVTPPPGCGPHLESSSGTRVFFF